MTLVVEDGTGLANAESYVSYADYQAWADARGIEVLDQDTVERRARQATEYADSYRRLKGARKTTTQALEFPRTGMIDWSSQEVTGVPKRLKDGVCYLISTNETLFEDLDRGGMIKSETVGPLSTTYVDGAPVGKVFTTFDRLMSQYYRQDDGALPPTPYYTSSEADPDTVPAPSFGLGLMDYTDVTE